MRRDEVDMVVLTHLHRDHVGWNLMPQGERYVPTFPNARYWMGTKDWDVCHQPEVQPQRFPNAPTCIWPLADLGLIELMDGEHSITPELTALPTPGHTPGHMSILITSQGARAGPGSALERLTPCPLGRRASRTVRPPRERGTGPGRARSRTAKASVGIGIARAPRPS